jgi:hypothetical protein
MKATFHRLSAEAYAVHINGQDTQLRLEKYTPSLWSVVCDRDDSLLFTVPSLDRAKGVVARILESAN